VIAAEAPSPEWQALSFATARFQEIMFDLPPLFLAHWKEVAIDRDRIALEPNFRQYQALDEAGCLAIQTARWDGDLAGYFFTLIVPHLHYQSCLAGLTDMYYLNERARVGWGYPRFFRYVMRDLAERGVKKHWTMTKCHLNPSLGQLWERMGYRRTETVYTKILEG
jgi:hypothetical protein